ncbi:Membrane associated serine protease, rhomboid family [Amphiplicatus metriothermophilus]|uniref:Membrane associated serine protease, rhomboid family n=1 Tax=Amphiplicatus metriothermophilus TaxID=1519374 RepID=A0A239PYT3_9PROT|nr:Membrane associated serine protease, rhomboid family [Amphiplicatus metriothermophilus]
MIPVRDSVANRYPPVVTWALLATNCAVFLFQAALTPRGQETFVYVFSLVPARFFALLEAGALVEAFYPLLTNAFLHAGFLHLAFNMWSLLIFGPSVEDRLGSRVFLGFYLIAAWTASLAHAFFNANSLIPALGASGAIAGVMGCYVRLFPFARLVLLVPVLFYPVFVEAPAILFSAVWLAMQLVPGLITLLIPGEAGGIAWWAHIGGFAAGWALGPALRRRPRGYRPYFQDEGVFGFTPDGRRHWRRDLWE